MDGLWVAGMLSMLHRHAPEMPLANISQMVNCILPSPHSLTCVEADIRRM